MSRKSKAVEAETIETGDETVAVETETLAGEVETNAAADDPTVGWTPSQFVDVAKDTAEALCSQIDLALKKDNPAAIRFREDLSRLLEQVEIEIQ